MGLFFLENAMLESIRDCARRFFVADDDASRHGKLESLIDLLSFPIAVLVVCGITCLFGLLTGAIQ